MAFGQFLANPHQHIQDFSGIVSAVDIVAQKHDFGRACVIVRRHIAGDQFQNAVEQVHTAMNVADGIDTVVLTDFELTGWVNCVGFGSKPLVQHIHFDFYSLTYWTWSVRLHNTFRKKGVTTPLPSSRNQFS